MSKRTEKNEWKANSHMPDIVFIGGDSAWTHIFQSENLKMHFVNWLSLLHYLVIILFVRISMVTLVHRKLELVFAQQNLHHRNKKQVPHFTNQQ